MDANPPALYHVGIVVADLAAAQDRLTELLGVTWGPVLRLDEVAYRDGAGHDLLLPTAMCYSVGHPSIELIEETPGTIWVSNEHSNLHHLGFWTGALRDGSADLVGSGCPLELCGRAGEVAPVSFAYHRDDALGVRFELVDATMKDAMSFLFEPPPGPA